MHTLTKLWLPYFTQVFVVIRLLFKTNRNNRIISKLLNSIFVQFVPMDNGLLKSELGTLNGEKIFIIAMNVSITNLKSEHIYYWCSMQYIGNRIIKLTVFGHVLITHGCSDWH